jgi:hypothetical protein
MMKPRTALVCFLPLLAACSIFDTDPSDLPVADGVLESPPDRNEAPALDGTPQSSDLDESLGVFVVPVAAKDDADGTRSRPFGSITKAIEAAEPNHKRVYLCEGTYREAIVVGDGIAIVGGLDCSKATWSLGDATTRSRIEAPSSPAVTAREIGRTTRLERLDVFTADAADPGASSVGLHAENANGLVIANVSITAGNAMKGADGTPAIQLVQTGAIDGVTGTANAAAPCVGYLCSVHSRPGGAGGISKCSGATGHDGLPGGQGGTGGMSQSVYSGATAQVSWQQYKDEAATTGLQRSNAPPKNGASGPSATTSGRFDAKGYVSADGVRGGDGDPGNGGNGGNGTPPTVDAQNKNVWYGNDASGGGAGGCPGLAGGEGKGGGASIAAFVVASPSITFDHVDLVAKDGGAGGKGTTPSQRTFGGRGGDMVSNAAGTYGNWGQPGGEGGTSGSGAGGPSIAFVHDASISETTTITMRHGTAGAGVARVGSIAASASGEAKDEARF